MKPYNDSCGPSLDPGVLKRMQRLDHTLRVTFSRWALGPDAQPLEVHPSPDWQDEPGLLQRVVKAHGAHLLLDPGFHLWTVGVDGKWTLVKTYPANRGFGHREVLALERDAARWMTPGEIVRRIEAGKAAREEKGQTRFNEVRRDVVKENESAIGDILSGGRTTTRAPRVFSYSGQGSRKSSEERSRINMSDEELGWVRPTPEDYK